MTYANVMSTLGVFIALGGTATAAVLITGANIKDGSVQSRDIANGAKGVASVDVRDGSLAAKDLSVEARKELVGAVGPAGSTGATGATGPRGYAAWDTIPSGTTVTGPFLLDVSSPTGSGTDYRQVVPLPGIAPAVVSEVNFASDASASTTDDDASCTGSLSAPTAPAGKVCLYLHSTASDSINIEGYSSSVGNNQSFLVAWQDTGANDDAFVAARWAYTAP
jgi:hypothetical protein